MNISIVTVFSQMYEPFLQTSLIASAQQKELVSIQVESFRSFVAPKERIDAPPFGKGAGMLIKPVVVERAIDAQEQRYGSSLKIFFSPQGKKLTQDLLHEIYARLEETTHKHLMILPARYEGMDTRVEEEYADYTISIGDFVLMGGDLPAMMFLEGFLRLIPGVIGKTESVVNDSFEGPFVDYPSFTEPVVWRKKEVPPIVRSGNHKAVDTWRYEQAVCTTVQNHFTWLQSRYLTDQQKEDSAKYIPSHYVVLMHSHVMLGDGLEGVSSVTSIDIHDIARSSKTYNIKKFFIVTPLKDQQRIVERLLQFWTQGAGIEYNKNRFEALKNVVLCSTLDEVLHHIQQDESQQPIVMATSARCIEHERKITYFDQSRVWHEKRPVLLVFGTGKGLSKEFVQSTDYLLAPVEGFSLFNHLSVRSAVAIVLDRWLGIHEKSI